MEMDVAHAVQALVVSALPRFGSQNGEVFHDPLKPCKALYMQLRFRAWAPCPEQGEDVLYSNVCHLLFARPDNYTKVWAVVNESWDFPSHEDFEFQIDHDSCWTSTLGTLCHKSALAVQQPLWEWACPKNVSSSVRFSRLMWTEVLYERDPDDSYRSNLVSLKRVDSIGML